MGKMKRIEAALKISMDKNHLYHSLLADLYEDINNSKRMEHLHLALKYADTDNDRALISKKLK